MSSLLNSDVTDLAHVKPDPDTCLPPDLSNLIKKELPDVFGLSFGKSDVCMRSDVSQNAPVGTRQIQENGKEVLLILDSDSEGEDMVALPGVRDGEDGMSSDTAVGDPNFSDFDSGGEEDGPNSSSEVNFSDSNLDSMSDIETEGLETLWLDDGLTSCVSNKLCKVT